jgi:prevent-host-death family protein
VIPVRDVDGGGFSNMRTVGLSEAKQKLSELVERASAGEQIGITCGGRLAAVLVPVPPAIRIAQSFASIEEIRRHASPLKGLTVKDLIEEGRR